jgi:competence protein ComEA
MLSRFMTRREQLVLLFVGCAIIIGALALYLTRPVKSDAAATDSAVAIERAIPTIVETPREAIEIIVSVQGAIEVPGVYRFAEGERIADALETAGGVDPQADTTSINLAARLVDGSTLNIPLRKDEEKDIELAKNHASYLLGGTANVTNSSNGGVAGARININTATASELEALPGVGPAYAQAIVDYRARQPFRAIEDVMEVRGIGEARFNGMRDLISVQ